MNTGTAACYWDRASYIHKGRSKKDLKIQHEDYSVPCILSVQIWENQAEMRREAHLILGRLNCISCLVSGNCSKVCILDLRSKIGDLRGGYDQYLLMDNEAMVEATWFISLTPPLTSCMTWKSHLPFPFFIRVKRIIVFISWWGLIK